MKINNYYKKQIKQTRRTYMTKKRILAKQRKKALLQVSIIILAFFIGYSTDSREIEIINDSVVPSSEVAHDIVIPNSGEDYNLKVASPEMVLPVMVETSVEQQIRNIAREENFKWENWLIRLAKCESTLNPKAINVNRNGTIDRGLFQWNDTLPPLGGITDDCAFSVDCSTRATIDAVNKGYQKRWMCNSLI